MKKKLFYIAVTVSVLFYISGCTKQIKDTASIDNVQSETSNINTKDKPEEKSNKILPTFMPITLKPEETPDTLDEENSRQVNYSYQWFREKIFQFTPKEIAEQFPEKGYCQWSGGYDATAGIRETEPDYSKYDTFGSDTLFYFSFEGDKLVQYVAKHFQLSEEISEDDWITEEEGKYIVQKFAKALLNKDIPINEIIKSEPLSGYEGNNFRTFMDKQGNTYLVQLNICKMLRKFFAAEYQ